MVRVWEGLWKMGGRDVRILVGCFRAREMGMMERRLDIVRKLRILCSDVLKWLLGLGCGLLMSTSDAFTLKFDRGSIPS